MDSLKRLPPFDSKVGFDLSPTKPRPVKARFLIPRHDGSRAKQILIPVQLSKGFNAPLPRQPLHHSWGDAEGRHHASKQLGRGIAIALE